MKDAPLGLVEEWCAVLRLLSLPAEPQALVASPDDEGDVLAAVSRVCPSASIIALDLSSRGCLAPDHPHGARPERIALTDFASGVALARESLDLVLLDHSMDDLVLDAIARREGIEPDADRGEHSPVLRALRAYWRSGEVEEVARSALAGLLPACQHALRQQAFLILSHRVRAADLPGQPFDLYSDYLALARSWMAAHATGFRELSLDGLHPHWWMCLKRGP